MPAQQTTALRWSGDLYDGWRASTVAVDPRQGVDTLAFKTYEHDIRLAWAASAARNDEEEERRYRWALIQSCPICGHEQIGAFNDPFFGSASLCKRCVRGVEEAAARRHHERYQAEIDAWVDEHWQEWQPKRPQREPGRGFHRA